MQNVANPTSRRIGQLIRMLSSDQPGEAGAAALALNRTLASAGLDIHKLADVVEAGLQLPLPHERPKSEFRPRPPARTRSEPRRPNGHPFSMDQRIICDAPSGLFRPCGCGGIVFTVMPGVGPHIAQLVCDECRRGGRWLSRQYFGATALNVVAQALALAAHGYPVFPVAASKRPTCLQGFKDAALEPREIRRLWRNHPAPLIGVPTGEPTGLFVLDIDSPRHTEAAEWLERCAPYLPETRQQTTRSGGVHLFFNHHQGMRNSAGRVAVGVDVRAGGGYIIVWSPVAWLTEPRPLADIPSWLIKAATPPPPPVVRQSKIALSADSARRKVEGIVGAVATAQAGQRNSLAFWGACRLAELVKQRILAERDAIALGIEAATQAGLSPKEAQRTIASAFRGHQ